MSKKKKKNKYFESYNLSGKKGKKGKGNKKDLKKSMKKTKTVHPTLTKKDGRVMRKELEKPLKVDKDFTKNRTRCNHADGTLSAQEYRSKYPGKAEAYTPMLQTMIDLYGEENIRICDRCYEVMVNRDQVSADDVKAAIATIYAGAGIAVANVRMKKDEVKAINKSKKLLDEFGVIIDDLEELEEKGSRNAGAGDAENLNDVGMTIDD